MNLAQKLDELAQFKADEEAAAAEVEEQDYDVYENGYEDDMAMQQRQNIQSHRKDVRREARNGRSNVETQEDEDMDEEDDDVEDHEVEDREEEGIVSLCFDF